MIRKLLTSKTLFSMAIALAAFGVAFAGGPDCHKDKAAAVHAKAEKGYHCHLSMSKDVAKTAKLTDDGAVVTLEGKSDDAVAFIKSHLTTHAKNAGCENCPFEMEGVSSKVKVTDKGGKVVFKGSNPEAIKHVQDWAQQPYACCGEKESA